VIGHEECDRLGMHVANVEALRRAVARLETRPEFVLSDGFPVALPHRERIMTAMHDDWPEYDFATHKGYITDEHSAALLEHGPCPIHRMRFVNVRRAAGLEPYPDAVEPAPLETSA